MYSLEREEREHKEGGASEGERSGLPAEQGAQLGTYPRTPGS